jgi:hypothetical protein
MRVRAGGGGQVPAAVCFLRHLNASGGYLVTLIQTNLLVLSLVRCWDCWFQMQALLRPHLVYVFVPTPQAKAVRDLMDGHMIEGRSIRVRLRTERGQPGGGGGGPREPHHGEGRGLGLVQFMG